MPSRAPRPPEDPDYPYYDNSLAWNVGFSAYWFANSWKWFLLVGTLPGQVAAIVPEGERNGAWGAVVLIGGLWAVFGAALFGSISDRWKGRWGHRAPFIAVGAALTTLALMFLAGADSLPALMLGYLLLQISDDVATGPYTGMVPEIVPKSHHGRASTIMNVLRQVGQIGSAVAGVLLQNVLLIYVGVAVVNLLAAVWTVWTIRHVRPRPRPPGSDQLSFFGRWLRPFKSRDFRMAFLMRMVSALAFFMITTYLVNFMKEQVRVFRVFGVELPDAATATNLLALAVFIAGAVGAGLVIHAADRLGRKRFIYLGAATIFTVLVPFALIRDYSILLALALVFGLGYGVYTSADFALVSDVIPNREDSGTEMGVWQASFTSVQLFTGGLGFAVDALNRWQSGAGYVIGIWSAGALFLLSLVFVRAVRGSY